MAEADADVRSLGRDDARAAGPRRRPARGARRRPSGDSARRASRRTRRPSPGSGPRRGRSGRARGRGRRAGRRTAPGSRPRCGRSSGRRDRPSADRCGSPSRAPTGTRRRRRTRCRARGAARGPQDRHHALAEPVGLLEVRVAGEDELVEAEVVVLDDAVGHLVVASRRARCRRRRAPGRCPAQTFGWTVERARGRRRAARPCAAARRTAVAAKSRLRRRDRLGVHALEQAVGLGPRLVGGRAGDDVEADAEAQRPAGLGGRAPRMRSTRSATIAGGSPHARYTSTCSAATCSAAGDAPPK